ncbi:hypothetical protein B0H14DRAFT_2358300 [Mycena olivaceomarginata]|nr:hypothetical protein B0H14DRAFT_2358300 [Mycena olivaceomarginata]
MARQVSFCDVINSALNRGVPGLHLLHHAIAGDAFHDSAERFPWPRCHPETREKLLAVLWRWTCGIDPPRNSGILWLYGPAGSGKSAVAQSLCQRLKEDGRLVGSFFFKRGNPSRGNARRLFPTLAYQLALLRPELKQMISQMIENDPAVIDRSFSTQLHDLIIEPSRNGCLSQPVCIVIDGLDECEGEDMQQEVLRLIAQVVSQERLPILFLIASRPESYIQETFAECCLDGFHRSLNVEQSFYDVRKYLLHEFGRIHREHQTMAMVPYPWPTSQIVDELVSRSSGYFIYVSTIIKYIDDK